MSQPDELCGCRPHNTQKALAVVTLALWVYDAGLSLGVNGHVVAYIFAFPSVLNLLSAVTALSEAQPNCALYDGTGVQQEARGCRTECWYMDTIWIVLGSFRELIMIDILQSMAASDGPNSPLPCIPRRQHPMTRRIQRDQCRATASWKRY